MPRTLAPGTVSESLLALVRVASAVLLLAVACELGARALPARLQSSARGTAFPYLEKNLAALEALREIEGGIDCIVMGSSAAASAIDPERMADVYAGERGGKRLRCYNASLPGLPAASSATLGRLLADRYHPRLLVYGVIPRDFTPVAAQEFGARLEDSSWVRYQMGRPTLEGWLSEHATAYRGFLALRDRIDPGRRRARATEALWPPMSPRGFLIQPTAERRPLRLLPAVVDELSGRAAGAGDPRALDDLLTVRRRGVEVVLVSLPVEPVLLEDYEGARTAYDEFVRGLSGYSRDRNLPFWDTGSVMVPTRAWVDEVHMTPDGAEVFSTWLGHRLAEAVGAHEIGDPAA